MLYNYIGINRHSAYTDQREAHILDKITDGELFYGINAFACKKKFKKNNLSVDSR